MYTGIVQGCFSVVAVEKKAGLHTLTVALDVERCRDVQIGASVAVDGVCLTVTAINGEQLVFDVMQQTLQQTTLGRLQPGDRVNIERSARYGDEIGGHAMSGHIDAALEIVALHESENNRELTFRLPQSLVPYVFERGYVGLDGCSLTVARYAPEAAEFTVCLIPETLRVTTFGAKTVGDNVNLELDRQTQAIVDSVTRYLADNRQRLRQLLAGSNNG
jgi:riboflavin synthase